MNRGRWRGTIRVLLCALLLSLTPAVKASASDRTEQLLENMSVRQKITQMFEMDIRQWSEDSDPDKAEDLTEMNDSVEKIIEEYDFGAVILFAKNVHDTEQSYNLVMDFQKAAAKNGRIPLMVSIDQEGGRVCRLGSGTALPGNMALGAAHDTSSAKRVGEIIGSELSALGVNTNLAPVVDVNNNANNPVIGIRSFGDDPQQVGTLASAVLEGLSEYNVIGCAKHFPGHGDTAVDSHYGLPIVDKSKEELLQNELKPYETLIDQGVEMIMAAHILYPQLDDSTVFSEKTGKEEKVPATMSKAIITDLLKGEMGFGGIVSTDGMFMQAIAANFDEVQATKLAIKAGADLICIPYTLYSPEDLKRIDAIIEGVEDAVESGEIPESRLDDAVRRILTVKEKRGILDWKESDYSIEKAEKTVGSAENKQAEREIAASAVTVVKNDRDVLPLDVTEDTKVLMLAPFENEISQLALGWNRAKEAGLIPDGAEVKVMTYGENTTTETLREDLDWADTYIVLSEINSSAYIRPHWRNLVPENIADYGKDNSKKTVVISVEKPYDVQFYENADAVMAVYGNRGSSIDVTEALIGGTTTARESFGPNIVAGVEVAFGTFGASGTLPVNVRKYDFDSKSYTDEIVYPRGYGLTYDKKKPSEEEPSEEEPSDKEPSDEKTPDEKASDETISDEKTKDTTASDREQPDEEEMSGKNRVSKSSRGKTKTLKNSGQKSSKKAGRVRTGDTERPMLWISLFAAAFAVIIVAVKKRKNG